MRRKKKEMNLKKKLCGDIQEENVMVVGFFAVGLNYGLEAPSYFEIGLFVYAW